MTDSCGGKVTQRKCNLAVFQNFTPLIISGQWAPYESRFRNSYYFLGLGFGLGKGLELGLRLGLGLGLGLSLKYERIQNYKSLKIVTLPKT